MKTYKFNDSFLDIADQFIYEVNLFKYEDNCWNLENSKLYSSLIFISDLVEFEKWIYDDFKLFKYTELIAAPIEWLNRNAILIEYETRKEKSKRKREEKKNELQN